MKPGLEATFHPTTHDIAWAAGIFEGEGYCVSPFHRAENCYMSQTVQIAQKDPWILYKLQMLFGGKITMTKYKCASYPRWVITGPRARGFLMTIYMFLSPRRQDQIKRMNFMRNPDQVSLEETEVSYGSV
jgi:hypothetical protein